MYHLDNPDKEKQLGAFKGGGGQSNLWQERKWYGLPEWFVKYFYLQQHLIAIWYVLNSVFEGKSNISMLIRIREKRTEP